MVSRKQLNYSDWSFYLLPLLDLLPLPALRPALPPAFLAPLPDLMVGLVPFLVNDFHFPAPVVAVPLVLIDLPLFPAATAAVPVC